MYLGEQKKAAQKREQQKNDLVVYLAHDLKTPLTSVVGYLSLLQESPEIPETQKARYIEISLQKALHLEALINEFFDITRFNLQNIQLEESRIKLALMLEQIVDEFYLLLAAKNMQAHISADAMIEIDGDANKLARVFSNLLKNAVMYGYDNSTIELAVMQQQEQITISFKNKGQEISAQQIQHVFEKFYRLDSARSSHTGGAGLGLAIAQQIVEAHHGKIVAQSNKGDTEFCVVLLAIMKSTLCRS